MFNKQKPWYFNYFDRVKESVEEMLVMLKAAIKMLIPALLVLVREREICFSSLSSQT